MISDSTTLIIILAEVKICNNIASYIVKLQLQIFSQLFL